METDKEAVDLLKKHPGVTIEAAREPVRKLIVIIAFSVVIVAYLSSLFIGGFLVSHGIIQFKDMLTLVFGLAWTSSIIAPIVNFYFKP